MRAKAADALIVQGTMSRKEVVELAGQDLVEVVAGEPDAVVGDAVLLEVVGAHLLGPAPATDLPPPLLGQRGARARLLP